MERQRQTHSKEIESKDEDVEEIRRSCSKKVATNQFLQCLQFFFLIYGLFLLTNIYSGPFTAVLSNTLFSCLIESTKNKGFYVDDFFVVTMLLSNKSYTVS